MSWSMKMTRAALRLRPKSLQSAETLHASLRARRVPAPVPRPLRNECAVRTEQVAGRDVITLSPRDPSGTELIYTHGGAYVNPMVGPHWQILRSLIRHTGATVTVPYYGLAPEHVADEAYPFLDEVSARVRARAAGRPVFLAGDSAGGGLALGQAIRARDAATLPVDGLFLFSPWLDVTMSNPQIEAVLPHDPMLAPDGLIAAGRDWSGHRDVHDPLISPINDPLNDLPPMFIYQGGQDIFLPDTKAFTTKALSAGSRCELRIYPDGFHVFVGATWTPESRRALAHVARTITTT